MTFREFEKKHTDGIRPKSKQPEQAPDSESESHVGGYASWKLEELRDPPQSQSAAPQEEAVILTESRPVETESESEPAWEPQEEKKIHFYSNRSVWWGSVSGLGLIIIIAVLLSTVFARLTITATSHKEQIAIEDVEILLDASLAEVRPESRAAPAERLEFRRSVSRDFESTGKQLVEEKARGKVRIYNRFSSSPQGLAATTRFLGESGVLYRLPAAIVVPGAKIEEGKVAPQFIEAELAADKAGEEANLEGEVTLNIPGFKGSPKYEGFYALAPSGFRGGFKGEARVVSKDDLTAAQEQVTKAAFEAVRDDMRNKIPPELRLVEALREVEIREVTAPEPGMRQDNFSVEASAVGTALVFREDDLKELLSKLILGGDPNRALVNDSFALGYRAKTLDSENGRAEVIVRGEAKVKTVINEDELARLASGKKEGSLIEVLKNRQELAAFNVAFFPPWLFKAPEDSDKIRVILEDEGR